MAEQEMQFEAGKNTHENVIFTCFGGMSNTGVTAGLAAHEAVKELGLRKACIGCLAAVPLGLGMVAAKAKAARKIVTVDGCPQECARKLVEQAGYKVKSIVLVRDIGMQKKPLHTTLSEKSDRVMDYVNPEDIRKGKELIITTIQAE